MTRPRHVHTPPGRRGRTRSVAIAAATGLVGALVLSGAGANAAPGDLSEAEGRFLSGTVAGLDLDTVAALEGALAETPSGTPLDTHPLSAEVLSALEIDLTGALQLLGPNGVLALGAVNQYAEANPDGSARAASGALSDQGTISVGGSAEFPSDARLELTQLLGPGFESVVADLDLTLGALSATAEATGGTAPTGDYQIAGATLELDSPAVSGIATTVDETVVPAVDGAVGSLVGSDGLLAGALDTIGVLSPVLAALGSSVQPEVAIDLDLEAALAPVLDEDFGSEGVVVNVGAGTVTVDLDTILGGEGSLNGFDPNTEVLDDAAITAILAGLSSALDDLTLALTETVETALQSAELTFVVDASILGGLTALDISVVGTLGDIVAGNTDEVDAAVTASLLGGGITLPIGTLVGALAAPLNAVLFGDSGIVSTLTGTLNTAVVTPVVAALSPVFQVLDDVVSLVVNVQEPSPAVVDETFTQRAATLTLLSLGGGTPLAQVHLASASVRGTAAIEPSLTVDPTTVAVGDSTDVTGEGYTPDSTVTVEIRDAEGTVVETVTGVETDGEGGFTTPITVPAGTAPGEYVVVGIDDTTGTEAVTPLTVEAAAIDPGLTVDPTTVPAGTPTDVTGTGYTPSSTVTVEIRDGEGTVVASLTGVETDDEGGFTTPITVPVETAPGEYVVVGIDDTTGTEAETPLTVEAAAIEPSLTVDPTTVVVGDSTDVTGEGYTPDSTVTVEIRDGSGTVVETVTGVETDGEGGFTTPITVPVGTVPGEYVVVGIDDTTGTEAETPLTVEAAAIDPSVTVDPSTVVAGEATDVTGEGYTLSSTVTVEVRDASGTVVATVEDVPTDATGAFTTPVTIPAGTEPGTYTVVGIDDTTGTEAEAPLTVEADGTEVDGTEVDG
ncbi:choice-of-anchor G family protein, partial [Cellulosimicrobium sp. BIT-GX5]|nr:choice-of-anchor G family protein [Cellulosimicrobium composti]